MSTYRPLSGKILVKPHLIKQTKSGIVLSDKQQEKQQKGEIVAIGKINNNEQINVGDIIMYPVNAGTKIVLDNNEYIVMSINEILLVL